MNKKPITDVFFDLDHTLWDFEKNSSLTFQKILDKNNINIALEDFLEVYIPANLEFWKLFREDKITKEDLRFQRLSTVFEVLNYSVSDHLINTLSEEYITYLSTYTYLFPNTIEILNYLSKKYNLHIITNGFQEVQAKKMQNSGILNYFKCVIDSESAGVKKPNPIIFKYALDAANVKAENAIMIGDSIEADIIGAADVGIQAIHFNAHLEPLHNHCPMIHDLIEIKSYI